MYAKTIDERGLSPVLVAEAGCPGWLDPRIVRLYRGGSRPEDSGTGRGSASRSQFWVVRGDLRWGMFVPVENSLTRKVLPRNEIKPGNRQALRV